MPENSKQVILFCKGDIEQMVHVVHLDEAERNNLLVLKNEYKMSGKRGIVYARRVMERSEFEAYKYRYDQLKQMPVSQVHELDSLARVIEHKLEFLGIIGIQDEFREGA
jgi:magnesium-transporting ATPase (P-type)